MEALHEAFMPTNLIFTVLLIGVILYWLMVILGALDTDFLNIDFDADVDTDYYIDADADMDIQGGGFLRGILEFFYVGEIPVMVLLSILLLSMWTVSMLANHYLNPAQSFFFSLPILAGNLLVSIFIVKVLGVPMKNIFGAFNKDANASRKVMGRICTVITTEATKDRMGQAEMSSKGAPIVLNVIAGDDHVFHKGDEAVVVGQNKKTGVYTIATVELEN